MTRSNILGTFGPRAKRASPVCWSCRAATVTLNRGGWLIWKRFGSGRNAMTSIFGPADFNGAGFMDVLARQSTDRDHRLISYWRMVLPVAGTRELGVAQCGIEIPNLGSRHSVPSGPAAYGAHRRAAADASGNTGLSFLCSTWRAPEVLIAPDPPGPSSGTRDQRVEPEPSRAGWLAAGGSAATS